MVSTNQLKFIKYFLIVILSIGLYFTWLQKDKFEATSEKLKTKTDKLKEKIKQLKLDIINSKQLNLEQKELNIILPKDKIDYSKIIPKINYDNIDLKLTNKDEKKEDNIQISPNISLDEGNKIEKIEVKVQTKF